METVNPANPAEYRYRGEWKPFETVHAEAHGQRPRAKKPSPCATPCTVPSSTRTLHATRLMCCAGWAAEPGTAGYMAGLALARAHDWKEFRAAMAHYKVPSENLVYADTKGNIGWQVGGLTPIRDGWSGLLPVPGDEGRYEWKGFRNSGELPFEFNPPRHYIATANHNILPPGYTIPLGYDAWAQPFRVNRIREMLASGRKFDIDDFVRMQQDVTSSLARRFVAILRNWRPQPGTRAAQVADELRRWDGVLAADSRAALVYEVWMTHLPAAMGRASGGADVEGVLRALETQPNPEALQKSLDAALEQIAAAPGRATKRPGSGANSTSCCWPIRSGSSNTNSAPCRGPGIRTP